MIAGVLKSQMDEAKTIGTDQLVANDDDNAIANLQMVDVVTDTVNGSTAEIVIAKASREVCLLRFSGHHGNAEKYPNVMVVPA